MPADEIIIAPKIIYLSGYSEKKIIPSRVAKTRSKYVKGARKDASDLLRANTNEKWPNPPNTPNKENKRKSLTEIGSK